MTTPSAERSNALNLRAPKLVFGVIAMMLIFALPLIALAWAGGGFSQLNPAAMQAIALPVGLAVLLAAASIARGAKRGAITRHWSVIWRAASAFAAMGLAWPLSFGVSALTQGDTQTAFAQAAAAPLIAFAAAPIGALAGAVTAYLCASKRKS